MEKELSQAQKVRRGGKTAIESGSQGGEANLGRTGKNAEAGHKRIRQARPFRKRGGGEVTGERSQRKTNGLVSGKHYEGEMLGAGTNTYHEKKILGF